MIGRGATILGLVWSPSLPDPGLHHDPQWLDDQLLERALQSPPPPHTHYFHKIKWKKAQCISFCFPKMSSGALITEGQKNLTHLWQEKRNTRLPQGSPFIFRYRSAQTSHTLSSGMPSPGKCGGFGFCNVETTTFPAKLNENWEAWAWWKLELSHHSSTSIQRRICPHQKRIMMKTTFSPFLHP